MSHTDDAHVSAGLTPNCARKNPLVFTGNAVRVFEKGF
ncbi:hypothetical protein CEV31_1726 [Brucella thiophenivorans]|uniref:Uncharacterized protein n=1 Tax=Brucella thiophenivorans TaxID=571255 RepID=A0A256FZY8_9HYPH|nr:hypothetical protein CEV31_1726 [Brucella thiophenivorans]